MNFLAQLILIKQFVSTVKKQTLKREHTWELNTVYKAVPHGVDRENVQFVHKDGTSFDV